MIDDEKKRLIVEGWNGGLTGGELAALHRVTRNVVMGVLSRARDKGVEVQERTTLQMAKAIIARKDGLIKGRPSQLPDTRRRKPEPSMPLITSVARDTARKVQTLRNLPAPTIVGFDLAAPGGDLTDYWVPFMNLQNNAGCRYSLDAKLFCNAPGYPYCPEHKAIVNPPEAQRGGVKKLVKSYGDWR